jgi:hypothetical protein
MDDNLQLELGRKYKFKAYVSSGSLIKAADMEVI